MTKKPKVKLPKMPRKERMITVSGAYRTSAISLHKAFDELAMYFSGLAEIANPRKKPKSYMLRELNYALRNNHSVHLPGTEMRVESELMDVSPNIGRDRWLVLYQQTMHKKG